MSKRTHFIMLLIGHLIWNTFLISPVYGNDLDTLKKETAALKNATAKNAFCGVDISSNSTSSFNLKLVSVERKKMTVAQAEKSKKDISLVAGLSFKF